MASVLIKNGLIVNGAGTPPEKNDIFIRNGKIVEIGNLKQARADETFDAVNALVVPGFIDVDSEIDHSLEIFSDPGQAGYLRQGITTVIGGNSGWSLAPIINEYSLDFLSPGRQRPTNGGVNFHWQDVSEFLDQLTKRGLGINFATLTGYSNIRRAFARLTWRDLSEKEMSAAMAEVAGAIEDGAFGCSVNLNDVQSKKISKAEITKLIRTIAEKRGLLALRLSDRLDNISSDLKQIIELAKEYKINLEISRFQSLKKESESEKIRVMIEEAAPSHQIGFDCALNETAILEPRFFLPPPLNQSDRRTILDSFAKKEWVERIVKNIRSFDPEKMIIRRAPNPISFIIGRSLAEFSENRDLDAAMGFISLFEMTGGEISFFYRDIDEENQKEAALSPYSLISAGDGKNSISEFIKIASIANWPIEKTVAKLAGQPAKKYRLADRGFVKKGFFADLLILRDLKPSTVIVNGSVAFSENSANRKLNGRILKNDR